MSAVDIDDEILQNDEIHNIRRGVTSETIMEPGVGSDPLKVDLSKIDSNYFINDDPVKQFSYNKGLGKRSSKLLKELDVELAVGRLAMLAFPLMLAHEILSNSYDNSEVYGVGSLVVASIIFLRILHNLYF
jgi:hypothetical protein